MPTKKETFSKYKNKYFIETGSHLGNGIQQALDAGFDNVISIELSDKYFGICENKFKIIITLRLLRVTLSKCYQK